MVRFCKFGKYVLVCVDVEIVFTVNVLPEAIVRSATPGIRMVPVFDILPPRVRLAGNPLILVVPLLVRFISKDVEV